MEQQPIRDKLNIQISEIYESLSRVERESARKASSGQLSVSEMHTLEAIEKGRGTKMTDVAARLGVTISTLTIAVNRLVQKSLVERARTDSDRRIVQISLTGTGHGVVAGHRRFRRQMLGEIISGLQPDELNFLSKILDKFQDLIQI